MLVKQLLQLQNIVDNTIERYYQYVKKDEAWKIVTTKAVFETDFAKIKQVAKSYKQNCLEEARATIVKKIGKFYD